MGSRVSGSHERSITSRLRLPPCSSLWGVVSCKGAATSLVPRVSVFVIICLSLRPSSFVSVVVPSVWSRGHRLSVRYSTSRVWKPLWRARSKCVWYSVKSENNELIVKRPLLCCDVLPQLTSKSFGRVFPHIKFNHLYWGLNCLELGLSNVLCFMPVVLK